MNQNDSDNQLCPIGFVPMKTAVIDEHGHSFEQSFIEEWLKKNKTCPMTGKPFSKEPVVLIPNRSLRDVVEERARVNVEVVNRLSFWGKSKAIATSKVEKKLEICTIF